MKKEPPLARKIIMVEKVRNKTLADIHADGFQAYISGNELNPYQAYSMPGISWQRGWNTARYGQAITNANPHTA